MFFKSNSRYGECFELTRHASRWHIVIEAVNVVGFYQLLVFNYLKNFYLFQSAGNNYEGADFVVCLSSKFTQSDFFIPVNFSNDTMSAAKIPERKEF